MADHSMKLIICLLVLVLNVQVHGHNVSITIMHNAVSKGAVCLDGTPPAYFFDPGYGDGANNWLVSLSGGAWCNSAEECLSRTNFSNGLGSSNLMPPELDLPAIMSSSDKVNPDFYNWNKVFVGYCDGASFSANVEEVNQTTNLHLRGSRIFDAVMEELRHKGMDNATNAILAGASAGGLATMLKCDDFRNQLGNVPRVKCISDGGLFFQGKGINWDRGSYFRNLVDFHGLAGLLPKPCTSKMDPHLCVFPENFIEYIKTPVFILQSQFDVLQLKYMVTATPNKTAWRDCVDGIKPCSPDQRSVIKEFQTEFLAALPIRDGSFSRGIFVDSCLTHDHSFTDYLWNQQSKLNNNTVAEAIGNWYFDRTPFQEIENVDRPYKCRTD